MHQAIVHYVWSFSRPNGFNLSHPSNSIHYLYTHTPSKQASPFSVRRPVNRVFGNQEIHCQTCISTTQASTLATNSPRPRLVCGPGILHLMCQKDAFSLLHVLPASSGFLSKRPRTECLKSTTRAQRVSSNPDRVSQRMWALVLAGDGQPVVEHASSRPPDCIPAPKEREGESHPQKSQSTNPHVLRPLPGDYL